MARFFSKLTRIAGRALTVLGAAALLLGVWLMSGQSTGLEKLVIESDAPRPAQAIICIAGGIGDHALPTQEGWDRIYVAVQLQADGLAPTIVFSGGGTEQVSEAEVYAEVARWLGAPAGSIVLDTAPGSTAEHPGNLLKLDSPPIRRDTPLLVVTSRLHSKRVAMCFRKAGFSNVRLITSYEAEDPLHARGRRRSVFPLFTPSGKSYGDPLNRLRWGFDELVIALRELVAIGVYRYRGLA